MKFAFIPKSKKMRIVSGVILGVALCFLWTLIWIMTEIFWDDTNETVSINIPAGAGVAQIAEILEQNEVIDSPFVFRVYEKLTRSGIYHSGVHTFSKGMSYDNILDSLEKSVTNAITVSIPEGYEIRQIAELLEKSGVCTASEFYKAQKEKYEEFKFLDKAYERENPLEGYIFPDTYKFERGQSATTVIKTMLSNFDKKVYQEYVKNETDKSLDDIIILASIVEREAANESEWGKVASVFSNRLKIGMKLQSCATVQYILKERKDILTNEDIKIDSPYNTYVYEGLPKGPIASPGLGAVKAALYPEETDYFYFAATKDGSRNVFSKTGEEHLKTVKELQK